MLRFEGVSFKRDGGVLLSDINFEIKRGRCLCAVGKNGAGKSTLCRLAGGLLLPTGGRVTVDGAETSGKNMGKLRERISYVFQEPDRQLSLQTPFEEVVRSLKTKNIGGAEETAEMQCTRFGLSGDEPLFAMSRGARQMTAVASAVAPSPSLLILDEPTSALDTAMRRSLAKIMEEEKSRGAAILLITHDPEFAALCADDMLVLNNGNAVVYRAAEMLKDRDAARLASFKLPVLCDLALRLGVEPDLRRSAEELAAEFCGAKKRGMRNDKESDA